MGILMAVTLRFLISQSKNVWAISPHKVRKSSSRSSFSELSIIDSGMIITGETAATFFLRLPQVPL